MAVYFKGTHVWYDPDPKATPDETGNFQVDVDMVEKNLLGSWEREHRLSAGGEGDE